MMPRFTASQLVTYIGVAVFVLQLVLIRNETKNIITENKVLSDKLQSYLDSQVVKSPQQNPQLPALPPSPLQLAPQFPPPGQLPPRQGMGLPPNPNLGPPGFGLGNIAPNYNQKAPVAKVDPLPALPTRPPDGKMWITSRFFGITANAGLGNQLFELVSVLGIASTLNRTAFINVAQNDLMAILIQRVFTKYPNLLEQYFYRFDLGGSYQIQFNNPQCCRYDNVSRLLPAKHHSILLDGVWFQSHKYFHHLRKKVREWIVPHPFVVQSAGKLVPPEVLKTHIICVHTRRGDFVTDNYHKPSDEAFTLAATQFLVEKLSVVVMGNDPLWTGLLFMGRKVHPLVNTMPEQDLSFSQQYCDEVLTTAPSSTFGFWIGYLAKENATVYYRDIFEVQERVIREFVPSDFFPKEWTRLKFADGKVFVG